MRRIDLEEQFLTKEELAKLLKVHPRTIQRLREKKKIPVTIVSAGLVRFPRRATLKALGLMTIPALSTEDK